MCLNDVLHSKYYGFKDLPCQDAPAYGRARPRRLTGSIFKLQICGTGRRSGPGGEIRLGAVAGNAQTGRACCRLAIESRCSRTRLQGRCRMASPADAGEWIKRPSSARPTAKKAGRDLRRRQLRLQLSEAAVFFHRFQRRGQLFDQRFLCDCAAGEI